MSKEKKVYIYPSKNKKNSYINSLKGSIDKNYEIIEGGSFVSKLPNSFGLLNASLKADAFVINWIENVGFLKGSYIQYILAVLSILLIKLRGKKLVWIFHNIHPHQGENSISRSIKRIMFQTSDLIISHSKEAADYAKTQVKREDKVVYKCHPIKETLIDFNESVIAKDVLYWGDIYKYKGVPEFLQYMIEKVNHPEILIIGKCREPNLEEEIRNFCKKGIEFNNSFLPFETLAGYIAKSKFVIFPYIGDSISSSGVLMNTIMMGGNPVGPNRGAFKDLSEEGVCFVYDNYDEMYEILISDVYISDEKKTDFIKKNSWNAFGAYMSTVI